MLHLLQRILFSMAILLFSQTSFADSPVFFANDDGVAVSGYDPVAYFTEQKPTKGDPSISVKHENATYYFSSIANRDKFLAEPASYMPQYGGYCAYAASLGKKAPTDPNQWTVRDGKLYLNYDAKIQKQWLVDPAKFIQRADSLWEEIKND